MRQHGKYGRRSPKDAPALRLSAYLTGVVPAHPAAADYLATLRGWKMLGNGPDPENAANGVPADGAGDCVPVTWANTRRLVTAALTGVEHYPSLAQVVQLYKTQNPRFPAQDDGMDIQTCLEYLVKTGGPDGVKALGFAKVDHSNAAEVKAAIAVFGSVWTGINVLDVNQDEFAAGQPWDYSASSSADGGHSIITGGYGGPGAGPLGGDERFITWGQETSFTDSFWSHDAEEAWVVIWPEHLASAQFMAGMDMATFAADYTAITGKPFPAVVPPVPVPVPPAPAPAPPSPSFPNSPADLAHASPDMIAWAAGRHVGENEHAAKSFTAWRTARGL